MASVNLSGILKNPEGEPDVGAIVRFTLLSTTGETVKSSISELIIPPDGAYNINLEYGTVRVDYITDRKERFLAIITVNSDTLARSIPELLNASTPPTNAQLLQFQTLLADTVTAKEQAVTAASSIPLNIVESFDNIAAMKASPSSIGDVVMCKAYHGGGELVDGLIYEIVAGATGVDDGGSYHNMTNGNQAKLIVGSSISVKQFGAKGDALADDTSPFQKSLDYAFDKRVNLVIPSASSYYSINAELKLSLGSSNPSVGPAIKISGVGYGGRLQLDAVATNFMSATSRLNFVQLENIYLDANNKATDCFTSNGFYCPYFKFYNCYFKGATDTQLVFETFVTLMDGVVCEGGQRGFNIKGIGTGPTTSVTLNSCYALRNSTIGFDFGFATYFSLNACACDDTSIAYQFNIAYSVSMSGCGAEKCDKLLYVNSHRGFTINSIYMLSAGTEVAPATPYLMEFVTGENVTISGVRISSTRPAGYTYLLGLTGNSNGNENITVTDNSITRDDIYFITNIGFDRPIKLIRGDQTRTNETYNVSTASELFSLIQSTLIHYGVNHTITIQLADGTYNLTGSTAYFTGLIGSGKLIMQGNASDRTLVKIQSDFTDLGVKDCNCSVVFKDLTVTGLSSNNSNTRLVINNSKFVTLDNVLIERGGLNVGQAISIIDNSTVHMINGSYATGSYALGNWFIDQGSKLVIERMSASPSAGSWQVGDTVQNSAPAASGNIGWVCTTSGEPAVWKSYGVISA